jgi:hypothetical protein
MLDPSDINPLALPSVPLEDRLQLPANPCVYFAIDSQGVVQYIGQTKNPRNRWAQHHRRSQFENMGGVRIAWMFVDERLLERIEFELIDKLRPPFNKRVDINAYRSATVVNRIPALMKAHGLSKEDLACQVKLSPCTVKNICFADVRRIDVEVANKLFQYFHLQSFSDLFEFSWN